MTVTLTGPLRLPGNEEPMAGAVVHIRFVAGSPRDVGYTYATPPGAVLGVWTTTADDNGDFTVEVPTIGAGITYPATGWYECTIGGGRWPKSVVKIQPTVDGTFVISDPAIIGTDLLPPEFTQVDPTADDISTAVDDYFATNPVDVTTEVDAALAGHPPLFVDNNLSELTDTQATARLNIGAASDSEMAADHIVFDNRIGSLELNESTDPALRQSTLDGAGLVVAPNFALVEFDVVDGVVTFNVSGTGAGTGSGAFQPLDSDLTAIAALTTTTFGRSLLTLANLAALRTTLGPTGTPSSSTYLRGDGTWATPAGGGGGSGAVDSVNGAIGDVVLGASDVGAQPVDSDLTAIAALTTTSFGRALLTQADAAATRTTLGLGSLATLSTIVSANITDGTIVNADISGTAAVAYSKLALTGAILNADLAGSIAYSKLSLTGAILDADLAGSIAYSKLNLTGNIVAADFSDAEIAALAGLTSAADRLPYFSGSGTASLATFTSAGRALVDDADAAAQRTTLGLGTSATVDTGTTSGTIATLGTGGVFAIGRLATGTPDGTKFVRDDGTLVTPTGSSDKLGLTPTAVKTANYTAAVGDLVPVDTTSGAVTVTLPTAPADGTVVAVKHVIQGGTNSVTYATAGSDVLNKTGGATSGTLPLLAQAVLLQYKSSSAIWYVVADDMPLAQLDTRYQNKLASDTLWDAAGDLVVGSGADTAAKLSKGSALQVLRVNSGATALEWAAAAGAVSTDTLWDTAGDLAIGTGADAATKLVVGTEGGQALTADPNATNKLSWSTPSATELRYRGTTSSLASTYDRGPFVETNNTAALSTGRLFLTRILLPKGLTCTSITFWSSTTAGASMTNQWFGLFDSSRVPLRLTSDDTSTAWAANTAKTLNLSSTFQTTYAGYYWLGIMVKGTTVPSVSGPTSLGTANIRNTAPFPAGTSSTGLTDPASCPNPVAALSVGGSMLYAEIS